MEENKFEQEIRQTLQDLNEKITQIQEDLQKNQRNQQYYDESLRDLRDRQSYGASNPNFTCQSTTWLRHRGAFGDMRDVASIFDQD